MAAPLADRHERSFDGLSDILWLLVLGITLWMAGAGNANWWVPLGVVAHFGWMSTRFIFRPLAWLMFVLDWRGCLQQHRSTKRRR